MRFQTKPALVALGAALVIAFGAWTAFSFPGQPMLMGGAPHGGGGGGGGVACDFGPNTTLPTGTIGTDLTAAGFTHCALNADFTDNLGVPEGASQWTMNNPNTYVYDCKGGSLAFGLLYFRWLGNTSVTSDAGGAPCNRLSIVFDATAGTNVLQYTFNPSDIAGPFTTDHSGHIGFTIYWPNCGPVCGDLSSLPTQYYYEITYRLSAGDTQTKGQIIDVIEAQTFHTSVNPFMDAVFVEALNNNSSSTATSMDNYSSNCPNGSKCTSGFNWQPDLTSFHTLGMLFTSDGSTGLSACFYYDGSTAPNRSGVSFDGTFCGHYASWSAIENQHDIRVGSMMGDWQTWTTPPATTDINASITKQIKSIRVFTCAPITPSVNCTGPIVFH